MIEQTAFTPKSITLVEVPTVAIIADMAVDQLGVMQMADWVKAHRPDCTPEGGYQYAVDLLPHGYE